MHVLISMFYCSLFKVNEKQPSIESNHAKNPQSPTKNRSFNQKPGHKRKEKVIQQDPFML